MEQNGARKNYRKTTLGALYSVTIVASFRIECNKNYN